MQKKEIKSVIFEYQSLNELNSEDVLLIKKAKDSALSAYAPYSEFRVGVSLLLDNGEFISGNNQENKAYSSGLCGERVAVFYANSQYPDAAIKSIAVAAYSKNSFTLEPVHPCGACLQVLFETEQRFNKPIRLILYGSKKIRIIESVKHLLPLHF